MKSAADYKDLLYRLMPRGPVWPQDQDSTPVWDSLLDALSQEPARVDAYADGIPKALIPAADMGPELLDSWEEILGLTPQAVDSTATRATAILVLLGQFLSPSLAELQAYADLFANGAVLTQHEYILPVAGRAVAGDLLYGVQWVYTWTVTYDAPQSDTFEAAMRAVSPQHTTLLFVVTP